MTECPQSITTGYSSVDQSSASSRNSHRSTRWLPQGPSPAGLLTISASVVTLARTVGRPRVQWHITPAVDYFLSSGLRVTVSDKEGYFLVLPEGMFAEKSAKAMDKKFVPLQAKPTKVERALALLNELGLGRLVFRVKSAKKRNLDVFSTKTHKPDLSSGQLVLT